MFHTVFKMITQSINSKSKLADYKEYYRQAKAEISELEAKAANKALSIEDYRQDYSRRLTEHNKEIDFLIKDITFLFSTAKRQVVELFPIN